LETFLIVSKLRRNLVEAVNSLNRSIVLEILTKKCTDLNLTVDVNRGICYWGRSDENSNTSVIWMTWTICSNKGLRTIWDKLASEICEDSRDFETYAALLFL